MQVLGRFGSLFNTSRARGRCSGFLVLRASATFVAAVIPVRRPFRGTGRRRPSLVHRVVGAGWRLGPVMVVMRFRLGGQTIVRRQRPVVVNAGAVAVERVLAATGHLVLDEPTYVRQQKNSLALTASEQVHLIGAARALCRVRIRCER